MDLERRWPLAVVDRPAVRDRLLAAYADPRRGYHDLRHLAEVLDRLDELIPSDCSSRVTLVLAAWFHDAVYAAAQDATDEELSARLVEHELAGLDPALVGEVARLVRLTQTHRPGADDLAGQLLCDADLAILAASAERYADYVAGVRREYAEIPDADFRAARRQVLAALLTKPWLFESKPARERWEQAARANLTAEVAALCAPAAPPPPTGSPAHDW